MAPVRDVRRLAEWERMKVGGKAQLTCPAAIAYGERGAGGGAIPPNAVLRFEVELLAINP